MRYSIRTILIVLIICAVAAAFAASEIRSRARLESEGRQTIVACLVCDHLLANTNQWPSDWDSLEPYFIARYQKSSPWSFADLKDEIDLDFDIDGPSLMGVAINAEKSQAFQAIQSKFGSNEYLEVDPNQIVLDHFRNMVSY